MTLFIFLYFLLIFFFCLFFRFSKKIKNKIQIFSKALMTPLMHAARGGMVECVTLLLDNGAKADAVEVSDALFFFSSFFFFLQLVPFLSRFSDLSNLEPFW